MTKVPNPVDRHVGARLRMRRIQVGLSQEKLGEALGITFQQIQKYEKGSNRIGASRLQLAAKVLAVPVNYFFDGAQTEGLEPGSFADPGASASGPGFYLPPNSLDADAAALLAAFRRITDPQLRTLMIELVEAMANHGSGKV